MKNQNPSPRKNDVNIEKNQTNTPNRKPTDHQKTEKQFDTLNPENESTKTGIQNNGKNDARTPGAKHDPIDREDEEITDEEENEQEQRQQKPIGNKTTPTKK